MPSPETLAKFDQAMPGLAERIVVMAEGNNRDRLLTNRAMRFVAMSGPILGFVLAMTIVLSGIWLIYLGRDIAGFSVIGTTVAAIIAAFWKRHKNE